MKLRWPALALVLVLIASLFLPAVSIHVHTRVDGAIAAQIPESVTLGKLIVSGAGAIHPTLTSLNRMQTARLELGIGLALAVIGGCLLLLPRRKATCGALWCSGLSLVLLGTGVFQWTNLDNSLLFEMMISLGIGIYVPVIAAAVTLLWSALSLKIRDPETQKPLCADDRKLRLISAGLALAALILFFLPAYRVALPDSVTGTPGDAAIMNRNISLADIMLGKEKNLYTLGQEQGGLKTPVSGELAELNAFSNDQNNVGGIFQIRSANTGANPLLMAVAALLLLSVVLGLIPKVDRWFSTVMISGAAVLLATEMPGLLTIGAGDMYASASRQLMLLGIGKITFVPLLAAAFAIASAVTGILGIRYANEPYFVNPLPVGFRIRFVAICLCVIALVCMLLPGATVSFSKPGKNKVLATATISGTDALTLKAAEKLSDPADSKGKPVYTDENPEATPALVKAGTDAMASRFTWLTWAALILTLAGTILLIAKANKRLVMAVLLCATVVRLVTWLALGAGLDRVILGTAAIADEGFLRKAVEKYGEQQLRGAGGAAQEVQAVPDDAALPAGGIPLQLSASVRMELRVLQLQVRPADGSAGICRAEVVQRNVHQPGQPGKHLPGAEKHPRHERAESGDQLAAHDFRGVPERDYENPLQEIRSDFHHAAQFHQLGAGILLRHVSVRGGYGNLFQADDGAGAERSQQSDGMAEFRRPYLAEDVGMEHLERPRMGSHHVSGGDRGHRSGAV